MWQKWERLLTLVVRSDSSHWVLGSKFKPGLLPLCMWVFITHTCELCLFFLTCVSFHHFIRMSCVYVSFHMWVSIILHVWVVYLSHRMCEFSLPRMYELCLSLFSSEFPSPPICGFCHESQVQAPSLGYQKNCCMVEWKSFIMLFLI